MRQIKSVRKLTTMGVLAAISVVLVALVHFPILPAAPFLEYDPADVPIFLATFMFGPMSGLLLTVVASIVQGVTVSASSGVIGIVMHILATGAFVLVAGFTYQARRTRKIAYLSLGLGALTMTTVMCLWNVIFVPLFNPAMDRAFVISMLPTVFIPFNLIKSGANAVITAVLYKSISNLVFRTSDDKEISL